MIIHSSNVGTVQFAQRLSIPEFHETIKAFGFGAKTGIDLPAEAAGTGPPSGEMEQEELAHRTSPSATRSAVTAIQTLRSMNVFATGGLLVRPHVVMNGGMPGAAPAQEDGDDPIRVISEKTARRARRPRLQPRRRGRHGQGRPASTASAPPARPERPRSWIPSLKPTRGNTPPRSSASRRSSEPRLSHDRRPRQAQGTAITAARPARPCSRTSPARSCATSASRRNAPLPPKVLTAELKQGKRP